MMSPPPGVVAAWHTRGGAMSLDRPRIFGILNVTPDSFSEKGRHFETEAAVEYGLQLVDEGADIIDVGGESTRPGAEPVPTMDEIRRAEPVIAALAQRGVRVSVDTNKAVVAEAAIAAGACIVNDVSGLRLDRTLAEVCAESGVGVVLMHSRGNVRSMATYEHATYEGDPVDAVCAELLAALHRATAAGIREEAVVLDPGIGFAKRAEQSLRTLGAIPRLLELRRPILVGASRKRFIGELTGEATPAERVHGTTGANVAALMLGARLFRVHDVRAARQALDVAWAILSAALPQATALQHSTTAS